MAVRGISSGALKRSTILLMILLAVFLLLLLRVFLIQTVDFERYQAKVIDQITTRSVVKASRGEIYDRNGRLLATNVTTYRLFISPSGMAEKSSEDGVNHAENISRGLSDLLGLDYETVLKQTTYVKYLDRTIARQLPEEKAQLVRDYISENEGYEDMIYLEAGSSRYYPYSNLASSVLGFTSSDGTGLYGLELKYNELLSGTDGYYVTARDSHGNEMPGEYTTYVDAINGADLTLTLDAFIQAALEKQLEATLIESGAANRACGIAIDVKSGGVLAMATAPSFDLNDAWTLVDYYQKKLEKSKLPEGSEEYEALSKQYLLEMWSNKALTDSYIPGSTFKVVTSSMALSESKVNLTERVFCSGSKQVLGHTIHCHKTEGHGSLTFAGGIQQSCNVWFMTLGQRLGTNTFYKYFKSFGYAEKTGIDLIGEGGSIISSQMSELDLAIYAFGQNFNVTPIQQIMAISAVANDGKLLTPFVVDEITDTNGNSLFRHETETKRQVVTEAVSDVLADILEEGVSGDGGAKNAYVAGYRVAAKTGTSEKKGAASANGIERYVCSCVAFAPADDPQIAVLIMVDEPTRGSLYGSTVAAPYIGDFLEEVLPYLGVEAEYTEAELKKLAVSVPNYQYWNVQSATKYAEEMGFEVIIEGDGPYVMTQRPSSGTKVEKEGAKLIFYTGKAKETADIVVPDVMGKTAVVANGTIINLGLNIKIEGTKNYLSGKGAVVVSQYPEAGTVVAKGSVVTVTFRYLEPDEETNYDPGAVG